MLGWWRGHPGGHASSYGRAAIADHLALMYGRMQRVRELVANVSFPPQSLAADPGPTLHPGKVPDCATRTTTGQTADARRTEPEPTTALRSAAALGDMILC